jgi:arabinogalactan endo-1,4-beta-galactosidase
MNENKFAKVVFLWLQPTYSRDMISLKNAGIPATKSSLAYFCSCTVDRLIRPAIKNPYPRSLFMKLFPFGFFLMLLLSVACSKTNDGTPDPGPVKVTYRGADISFLPEIREEGTQFYDKNGNPADVTDLLKQSGVNTIRLRLWHSPATVHGGLAEVTAFATELKARGFKIYLTIHYSDTWADPSQQAMPAAWEGLPLNVLSDSVYAYTKAVVQKINPDIIGIGNEINNGFLWPAGSLSNETAFITLLKKGIQGARDATVDKRKILIHCATLDAASWFFGKMKSNTVDYDLMGISYYPFWTRVNPAQAVTQLKTLTQTFYKDAFIAETAYPFTLDWNDNTNNVIGLPSQLLPGYPATPEGQKLLLTELRQAVDKASKVTGIFYWSPEWVAFRGPQSANGSAWENIALFDFSHHTLPALSAFGE